MSVSTVKSFYLLSDEAMDVSAQLHELCDFVEAPVPVTLVVGLIIHTVVDTVHPLQLPAHQQLPTVLRH